MDLRRLRQDLEFLLFDVGQSPERDELAPMLEAACVLAEQRFADHVARVDAEEPRLEGARVRLPPEVGPALAAHAEGGFVGVGLPEAAGGLGLGHASSLALAAPFLAANPSTASYPLLTSAAANVIATVGTAEQRARYLPPMLDGRAFGTMCLSEPQAGSSLADVRCRAFPLEGGGYRVEGDKMWISGGEHELSPNIFHLVLARLPDAPPGVKGISLFLVPRFRLGPDGAPGESNHVQLVGLNHKMGYRGTVNCALAFGGDGPSEAELIGAPHAGLKTMFMMMNEARLGVGLVAAGLAHGGYRHALDYARERTQGRHPDEPNPSSPPVAILEHADVRRMLLLQKAYAEGALDLVFRAARIADEGPESLGLLELLTPIAKAWPAEFGVRANDLAIQVLGGAGYTRDHPVERMYRDNRLNPIHEGTNGIQGLDLLGRKVLRDGGVALGHLGARIGLTIQRSADTEWTELGGRLQRGLERVAEVSAALGRKAPTQLRAVLAQATPYLHLLGHVVVGWGWLEQALAVDGRTDAYAEGKRRAARFYFAEVIATTDGIADRILAADPADLELSSDGF